MAAHTDYWGDIGSEGQRTPLAILREQAALLGTKTKNLVEATVDTGVDSLGHFVHRFTLVVPSLSSYKYELFRIEHGVAIYPITVPSEPPSAQLSRWPVNLIAVGSLSLQLESEQEFIDWLHRKLSSAETKRIIANLLAQATS